MPRLDPEAQSAHLYDDHCTVLMSCVCLGVIIHRTSHQHHPGKSALPHCPTEQSWAFCSVTRSPRRGCHQGSCQESPCHTGTSDQKQQHQQQRAGRNIFKLLLRARLTVTRGLRQSRVHTRSAMFKPIASTSKPARPPAPGEGAAGEPEFIIHLYTDISSLNTTGGRPIRLCC